MSSILYRRGVIHSPLDPYAEALLVDDGVIVWIGSNDTADGLAARADRVIDVEGAFVAPGFVDAHAHLLETGLTLGSVNLAAPDVANISEALADISRAAAAMPAGQDGDILLAYGWDEHDWPEQRPPTAAELDDAAGGRPVYAARVDVHSAVVSTALARRHGIDRLPGWQDNGLVTGEAHEHARDAARAVGPQQREKLYRAALGAAARSGIVALHEMSAPHLDTRDGLRQILDLTRDASSGLVHVSAYRGELCQVPDDASALLDDIPDLAGIGGDLNVDGSIGSHTAAMRAPYAGTTQAGTTQAGTTQERGELYLTAQQIAGHLRAVTAAGAQGAFHVIGDRAMDEFIAGLAGAASEPLAGAGGAPGADRAQGTPSGSNTAGALRAAGHRAEHALFVDARALAALLDYGISLSVQPAFGAHWGGPDGTYAARLGATRASLIYPYADLAAAGILLAFGSDSPVTAFDPWGAVLAAMFPADESQHLSALAAFRAHTREGWRALASGRPARAERSSPAAPRGLAGSPAGAGEIRVGAPAHLAVWATDHYADPAAGPAGTRGGSAAAWGTRAASPLLPELAAGLPRPRCRQTMRAGVVIYDTYS